MAVRIEGVSDVLRMFDQAPNELLKAAKTAMRKANSNEVRNLRKSVPVSGRKLVKGTVKARRTGDITAVFGMFLNSKEQDQKGRQGPEWFWNYWKNYGTLAGRDPNHKFDNAVKQPGTQAARNRRNNVGQTHENFYEAAVNGFEERYISAFKQSLKDQGYEIE